ncbi:MAG TPA: MAPEG family protein [Candidatus Limnocylindria bacterium]|nr:MAPEG family protein [Candidatus Limnocylindria bacterium]
MTTELTLLAWSALLTTLIPVFGIAGLLRIPGGLAWGLGNRQTPLPPVPAWSERGRRAHANMVENLAPFAAIVLIAHAIGRHNEWTVLGAQLFFWGRVAHVITYVAGLVPWRTLAFAVGQIGMLLIFLQLL